MKARRDNDGEPGCHGNCRCGKCLVVSGIGHTRDQHQSKGCHSCRSGTADSSPEGTYGNCCHGQTSGSLTDQGLHEIDDSGCNTGFFHNVASQNKERNGQKREFGDTCKKVQGEHAYAHIPYPDNRQSGKSQGHGNGYFDGKCTNKNDHHPEGGIIEKIFHLLFLPAFFE